MRLGSLARALTRDVGGAASLILPRRSRAAGWLEPGLRAYRIERNGGLRRLHLRVKGDGSGVLFVDVAEAVHLSRTATELVWLVLEGRGEREACRAMARRYRGTGAGELRAHYRMIREVVDRLSDPRARCGACEADLPRTPLFSACPDAPYKADLALTYACDNGCPHCYNEPSRFSQPSLDREDWLRVIDRLAEVGVPHLVFTGGEPTLHPHLVEIVSFAAERQLICGMNTNGRRLGDGALVGELSEAGLDHVQVTLNSHLADVHDAMAGARAFRETVAGIEAASSAGLHVLTNTTLTRANYRDAEKIVRFVASLGPRAFAMNGLICAGGGGSNPDALPVELLPPVLARVRDVAEELGMRFLWYTVTRYCRLSPLELDLGAKRCNAGEYSMCVEPNADVLPCQSYYEPAGNLLRDEWADIWNGDLLRGLRERVNRPRESGLPERCSSCPDLSVCAGGCPLERASACRDQGSVDNRRSRRSSGSPAISSGPAPRNTPADGVVTIEERARASSHERQTESSCSAKK